MKKAVTTIIILALLITAIFPNSLATENKITKVITSAQYEKGYRYNIQGWAYIHIEGEPYERGYQYGYLASAEIIDTLYRWSEFAYDAEFMDIFFIKKLPKNHDKFTEQFWKICRSRSMNLFLKKVPDEYVDEMKGMADGIKAKGGKIFGRDIEFEDIVTGNLIQDSMLSIKNIEKQFHPFRGIFSFDKVRNLFSMLFNSIKSGIFKSTPHLGHCSAFIATGDATKDGGIIIAQSTYFNPIMAERCNIILDVKPSKGNRFMMTSPPGSLWSQEDFYINEKGIVMTETEYGAKGPWKKGVPKGVRSRNAIQYSNSIDDAIKYLQKGNDGLIPNEWLIGDIKTGEIASLEQPLYNTKIKRTYNGFYGSHTTPHDKKVIRELFGILSFIPRLSKLYQDISANGRDKKFEELAEKYRGEIDEEIAKIILATDPINRGMTDGKITSSKLMENMGLLAFLGNVDGNQRDPTDKELNKYRGITELPTSGWLSVYPIHIEEPFLKSTQEPNHAEGNEVLWEFETGDNKNMNYSSIVVDEDIIYTATSSGEIYALKSSSGKNTWVENVGQNPVDPVVYKDLLLIGSNDGLHALDKHNGKIEWETSNGKVVSKPIIINGLVIASYYDNKICAYEIETGKEKWTHSFDNAAYISDALNNKIYIGSGKTCFCFNTKDKEIIWEYTTQGLITSAPKISGIRVYFGSWDGNLYALNSKNGDFKWKYPTSWGIDSTPDISDGVVYIGSLDNNFYAINEKDGTLKWHFTCKSAIHSNPVAYGDNVFFGCDDGRFYALNKEDGDFAWSYAPGYTINDDDVNNYITTPILSNPVVEDEVVYFGAKGNIYALDAQTVEKPKEELKENNELNQYMSLILFFIAIIVSIALIIIFRNKKKTKEGKK